MIQLDPNEITGCIFEENSHADTCLLGKGCKTLILHEQFLNVSRFSEDIGQLEQYIIDAYTVVMTENREESIIRSNKMISNPDD